MPVMAGLGNSVQGASGGSGPDHPALGVRDILALFVLIHVYMATTGETVGAYLKAMISGKEWVQVSEDGQ